MCAEGKLKLFPLWFFQVFSAQQLPKPADTKGEARTKGEVRKNNKIKMLCNL